jgi:hypothetical protein
VERQGVSDLRREGGEAMTLRRAVRLFVRAWTPHPEATFDEWLLAAAVIEAAISRDEQTSKPRSEDVSQ